MSKNVFENPETAAHSSELFQPQSALSSNVWSEWASTHEPARKPGFDPDATHIFISKAIESGSTQGLKTTVDPFAIAAPPYESLPNPNVYEFMSKPWKSPIEGRVEITTEQLQRAAAVLPPSAQQFENLPSPDSPEIRTRTVTEGRVEITSEQFERALRTRADASELERKHVQSERLVPSDQQIHEALTPSILEQMNRAGLNVNPDHLREKIVACTDDDRGLSLAAMEKMNTVPIGEPYVATGAVSRSELDKVLSDQKTMRDLEMQKSEYKNLAPKDLWQNPQWQAFVKQTDVGHLLRADAQGNPNALAKIDAADAFITKLQEIQRSAP